MKKVELTSKLSAIRTGDSVVAFEAAKSLIATPGDVPIKKLVEIARDRKIPAINRRAAVYALGFVDLRKGRPSAPVLAQILCDPLEDPKLRADSAEVLGHLRYLQAIPSLAEIARSNEDDSLRIDCVFALSKMWERRGNEKILRPAALAAIAELIKCGSPDNSVTRYAQQAMEDLKNGMF
jgi:HEAT repeat protein